MALDLGLSDLVWIGELRQQLPRAISKARQRSFLRQVAGNSEQAMQLPPSLRYAIAGACRSTERPRLIEDLARLGGTGRSLFCSTWRRHARRGLTPKVFLDWLLLLQAATRKSTTTSWGQIALELKTSNDTLASVANRLLGVPMSDIRAASLDMIRSQFGALVLRPLGIRAPLDKYR